jgi:hypothetical protein
MTYNSGRSTALHYENALAAALPIESLVGFLGLIEPPAVRKEGIQVNVPVNHKICAGSLCLDGHRP